MSRTYLRYSSAHSGGVLLSPSCAALQIVTMEKIMPDRFPKHTDENGSNIWTKAFMTAGARRIQFVEIGTCRLLHTVYVAQEGDVKDLGSVTTFHFSEDAALLYVGMSTGRVSIFQYEVEEEGFVEQGSVVAHRLNTKIKVICTNQDCSHTDEHSHTSRSLMASGGQDTSIVVWDVFAKEPVCRFEGHKGPIIDMYFLKDAPAGSRSSHEYILSLAEDGLFKVWDIAEDYCVQTICVSVTSNYLTASCYSMELGLVLVATKDNLLRAYAVNIENVEKVNTGSTTPQLLVALEDISRKEARTIQKICTTSWKDQKNRTVYAFLCVSKDRLVEVFCHVDSAKSRKRALRKQSTVSDDAVPSSGVFYTGVLYASSSKIVCASVLHGKNRALKRSTDLALGLQNNTIQIVSNFPSQLVTAKSTDQSASKKISNVTFHAGHGGEIIFITLNSNGNTVFTASPADGIRRWHFSNRNYVPTIESNAFIPCPNITSIVQLPDDTNLLCANSAGELFRVHLGSLEIEEATLIDKTLGGKAKVIAMCFSHGAQQNDSLTVYTGNSDMKVRAYSLTHPYALLNDPTRMLELPDVPTCIACCPQEKLLAVGLNDTSIRLYFVDSFRQYLKLYGHAYPPLTISISSDATLLVSGGMDKSLKIWGMDFGDIHRTIKAHEGYVTKVNFLPKTHYVTSVSKDGTAKIWDGDHWDLIQDLTRDTSSPVSALHVANDGSSIITGDVDGWLKAFERTNDTLFLTEEREKRMEQEVDREVEERAIFETRKKLSRDITSRTVSAVAAADALRDRIDRMVHGKLHAEPDEDPAKTHDRHLQLWNFLSQELRSVDLYHAMTSLSFDISCTILTYLKELLRTQCIDDVERCSHIVSILGRIHHRNLPSGLLGGMAQKVRALVTEEQARVNHNLAGLRFIKIHRKQASKVDF